MPLLPMFSDFNTENHDWASFLLAIGKVVFCRPGNPVSGLVRLPCVYSVSTDIRYGSHLTDHVS